MEKIVRSAGCPAASLRSMPRTRAGPVVKSSTMRIERNSSGVNKLLQRERERGFESE